MSKNKNLTPKKKKRQPILNKMYLFDGMLIVFSVLFALFINKAAENIQKANERDVALENIRKELQRNEKIMLEWYEFHGEILERINAMIEGKNDSLKTALSSYDYFNLGILTEGGSLVNTTVTSTAWETAKTTGIISEFDFETTQKLTEVYLLQDVVMNKSLMKIIDFIFDPDNHDMDNLDPTLIQLQLRFWELVGQEELLVEVYSGTQEDLE